MPGGVTVRAPVDAPAPAIEPVIDAVAGVIQTRRTPLMTIGGGPRGSAIQTLIDTVTAFVQVVLDTVPPALDVLGKGAIGQHRPAHHQAGQQSANCKGFGFHILYS